MVDEKKYVFEEYKRTRDRVMKRWDDTKKELAKYTDVDIKPLDPPMENALADDVLEQVEEEMERNEEHEDNFGM